MVAAKVAQMVGRPDTFMVRGSVQSPPGRQTYLGDVLHLWGARLRGASLGVPTNNDHTAASTKNMNRHDTELRVTTRCGTQFRVVVVMIDNGGRVGVVAAVLVQLC